MIFNAVLYALAVFLLSTQLAWSLQVFLILFSVFLGWLFFKPRSAEDQNLSSPSAWWLLLPLAALVFTRVFLFIKYSDFPQLGYDMGIYKYEFERARDFAAGLKTSFYPGLIILVSLMRNIGFSVSFFMREFYISLNVLIGVMIYLTGREYFGKTAGLFALVFYVGSITQFEAYDFFLYKNVLAISLLLGSLILLKRHSVWAIPVGLYLGVVQPPDFLILAAAMLAIFIVHFRQKKERLYLLVTGGTISALFFIVFLFRFNQITEGLNLILHNKEHWDPSISGGGVFIDFRQYAEQAIYYLPLVILGFIASVKKSRSYLHLAWVVSAVIVLFHFIFYKRYIIELDIFGILFAGAGMLYLWENYRKGWQQSLIALFSLAILLNIMNESWNLGPLIPPLEAARIGTLCRQIPEDALVMATHNFYSPWLRGYSCHETIAPGLFELNRWGLEGWQDFWSGDQTRVENRMKDLAVYGKPIYLFIGKIQPKLDFTGFRGFTQVQSYLWRWNSPQS